MQISSNVETFDRNKLILCLQATSAAVHNNLDVEIIRAIISFVSHVVNEDVLYRCCLNGLCDLCD